MARTIGVVLKRNTAEAVEVLEMAQQAVVGARFVMEEQAFLPLSRTLSRVEPVDSQGFESSAELVLGIGGDGTMIQAAALLKTRLVPILGVNLE